MAPSQKLNENGNDKNRLPRNVEEKLKKLRFQNYTPRAEQLKTFCNDTLDPNATLQDIIDKHNDMLLNTNSKFMDPALDLDNLLPKKGNSEMKYALSKRLERLNRRTKRAIIEIARKKQMEDGDLTGPAVGEQQTSSDEE